ncbi:hypothetical protein [Streptomyces sp. NPDC014734]|uniref:hypothetical protein n=1 Tax=Streptomyces sp. NPDC014734 TaxID=3364886 RepID=UPI0036FCF0B2
MKNKIKAAVLTAAVIAGTAVAATPAHALSECKRGSGVIICEYGVATVTSRAGVQYEFAIGTNYVAYVRTKTSSTNWTGWQSMGGKWKSGFSLTKINGSYPGKENFEFVIGAIRDDGRAWRLYYAWDGTRTWWEPTTDPY